ncbi:AaceriAFR118Wp [[Ashbya] aceris (nom. inval.)]|nr:AaceriAFR118Wp [[Ashbya] aceris (nom. inval.)]
MEDISTLEQAMAVIRALQEQLVDLDSTGKEYEFQLEQTIQLLRQELEQVQQQASEKITRLEIQIDDLQEQTRVWKSKYLDECEQNGNLLQDKLILECELENVKEEVARMRMDGPLALDMSSGSEKTASPTTPGSTASGVLGPALASPLSLHRSMSATNLRSGVPMKGMPAPEVGLGLLPQQHSPPSPQPIRVMFKGTSLMLQSMSAEEPKSIVPSLNQATVVTTTNTQVPRR